MNVEPTDVLQILSDTLLEGKAIDHLLYKDPITGIRWSTNRTSHFTSSSKGSSSAATERSIPPGSTTTLPSRLPGDRKGPIRYGARGGHCNHQEIGPSRPGGRGFPTGAKWESCRKAKGKEKFVICNADEGDPGAYMDRSLLEGNPHSVIEGMLIGAYAIGSEEGYVYVRNEYPLAVSNLGRAIDQAKEYGLLGKNILGSGLTFTLKVSRGGGAFVCGESTALMASLEGRVGEPRAKYIHTVEHGLWNQPSNLNNVETWANVPIIINGEWTGIPPLEQPDQRERRSSPSSGRSIIPVSLKSPWEFHCVRSFMTLAEESRREAFQGGPDRRPFRRLYP